jgi:hypothetical protein
MGLKNSKVLKHRKKLYTANRSPKDVGGILKSEEDGGISNKIGAGEGGSPSLFMSC